jgi:Flp pilus assembly protein TadB
MRKRITRVAPIQLGKVSAAFYGLFSIPFVVVTGVAWSLAPFHLFMPIAVLVIIPIFYVVFGFLTMAFGGWIYNVVAKQIGGIEFVTEELP